MWGVSLSPTDRIIMFDALALAFVLHTYTVKPGDTLSGISAAIYHDVSRWPQLCQRNRIRDCDLIFPGQVLRLDVPGSAPPRASRPSARALSGHLSCYGLERLWDSAGGAPWAAFTAAEIAMAESGGDQHATGPYGERGYWQVNTNHGALSTYDPFGNARAAIILSGNGRSWSAWTTFLTGAYRGRCLLLAGPLAVGTYVVVD